MEIGFKYCGGCNPTYERSSIIKRARAEFPHMQFSPFDPESSYALVVVICGCTQECFSFSCDNSTYGTVWVRSSGEYARLQRALRALETGPPDCPGPS